MRREESELASRRWSTSSQVALGVVAALCFIIILVAGAIYLLSHAIAASADRPSGSVARQEVVRWYLGRGHVARVRSCEWIPGDSESNSYTCSMASPCHGRVVFNVPRAGVPHRFDAAPLPNAGASALAACPHM